MLQAFDEGYIAFEFGYDLKDNSYNKYTDNYEDWVEGYLEAYYDKESQNDMQTM